MPATDPYSIASRKAKYGHKCWIAWTDRNGNDHAEQAGVDSLQRAIDAVGPDGKFTGFTRDTGTGIVLRNTLALVWLSNARIGMLNA